MQPRRALTLSRLILPAAALALAGMACQILNPTPVAWSLTSTPAASPTTAGTPIVEAAPTLKITLNPLPEPAQPTPTLATTARATDGPWLVYSIESSREIVMYSLAGGGERSADLPAPLLPGTDLQAGVSPDGNWLAFRTASEEAGGLALHLLEIQSGELKTLTALINPELEQNAAEGNPTALQAASAVSDPGGLAWSPDGRFLAYIGAADGNSSDLYVYDLKQDKISRLTRGSNQAAAPFWSPDGKWIINQEVQYNADGEKRITAVWAAAPDRPETRRLYTPALDSQGEVLISWTNSGNMLICSRGGDAFQNLREIPLSARWTEPIYTPPFASAAFDPASRQVVIVQNAQTSPASRLAPGVYSLPLRTDDVRSLQEGAWEGAAWYSQPGLFAASGPLGALALKPGGAPLVVDGEKTLIPSPDGQWLAGLGGAGMPGARLYQADGARLQEWIEGPVWQAAWLPDSSGLYLLGEQGLYAALFPTAVARLVAEGVPQGAAALAVPLTH